LTDIYNNYVHFPEEITLKDGEINVKKNTQLYDFEKNLKRKDFQKSIFHRRTFVEDRLGSSNVSVHITPLTDKIKTKKFIMVTLELPGAITMDNILFLSFGNSLEIYGTYSLTEKYKFHLSIDLTDMDNSVQEEIHKSGLLKLIFAISDKNHLLICNSLTYHKV